MAAKRAKWDIICGICGKIRPVEELVTSTVCPKACEHVYCMKRKLSEIPAAWYCEECVGRDQSALGQMQNSSKRTKITVGNYYDIAEDRGCFKQKSTQDSSGKDLSQKTLPKTLSGNLGCAVGNNRKQLGDTKPIYSQDGSTETFDNPKADPSDGTPNKQVTRPLSRGTSYREAKTPKTILIEDNISLWRRVRHGERKKSLGSLYQNDQRSALHPLAEREAPARVTLPCSSRAVQLLSEPSKRFIDADVQDSPSIYVAKEKNAGCSRVDTTQKIKASCTDGMRSPEIMRADLRELNLPLMLTIDQDGGGSYHSALQPCWKGCFKVLHVISIQYRDIRAYFPRVVCPKVNEIRKCLPDQLKFDSLLAENVLPRIFKSDPPTKDDIGLYFFCEEERHKEKYARFLQRLDLHHLAIRTCINGVYLLIFTSTQLPRDSQRINGEIYLWGVFLNMKPRRRNRDARVQSPIADTRKHSQDTRVQSPSADMRNNCVQLDGPYEELAEEVDMEIDMIGGMEIGRIDVHIKRISCSSVFSQQNASVGALHLKKVASSIHPDTPRIICEHDELFSSRLQSSSAEGSSEAISQKVAGCPDVPPGFCKLESPRCPKVPTPEQHSSPGASSKKVKSLIHPEISPRCSKLEPPECNKIVPHTSKEVMAPIHPDAPPGFAELRSPGLPKLRASKQQSLPRASKEKVSPTHPKIPPGFAEIKTRRSPKLQAPNHEISSYVATSKVEVSSRTDAIGRLSFFSEKDQLAAASESHEMQSKHYQASDFGRKSAELLGGNQITLSEEDKKCFDVFAADKLHSKGKKLPSFSEGEKGCSSTMNLCHKQPGTVNEVPVASVPASKDFSCGFSITNTCFCGIPKEESNVQTVSTNASSYAKEKGEPESEKTDQNKLVTMEVEGIQKDDHQTRGSKMQECKMTYPCEQTCQQTKEMEEVRREPEGNAFDSQLSSLSGDSSCVTGNRKPVHSTFQNVESEAQKSRPVFDNLMNERDMNCTETKVNWRVSCGVSDSSSSIPEPLPLGVHMLENAAHNKVAKDDSFTEEKTHDSTEFDPKDNQGASVPSICQGETISPGPELHGTLKDQNEKGRGKEVEVPREASIECIGGTQNIYRMLTLNRYPNCVSEVPLVSDISSNTLHPLLSAAQMMKDEVREASVTSYHSFTEKAREGISKMKRLCKLLSEDRRPDLITMSTDSESSSPRPELHHLLTNQSGKGRLPEVVSEFTPEDTAAENIAENHDAVGLEFSSRNYSSPACSHESILSPVTPVLQLFPEAMETIIDNVQERNAELGISSSVPLVSADISLSRPHYVMDGNAFWIPKSVSELLKRDGCGEDLRLSL